MFANTLLDSSPAREPVLKPLHRALAVAAGIVGFLAAFLALSALLPPEPTKLRAAQAAVAGLLSTAYVLMVCYVHADARRLGVRARWWFLATLCFSLIGFLAYLGFSAARTGNWRRAALPLGYIAQAAFVGALVVIPLIHVDALPELRVVHRVPVPPPRGQAATAPPRTVPVRPQPHSTAEESCGRR